MRPIYFFFLFLLFSCITPKKSNTNNKDSDSLKTSFRLPHEGSLQSYNKNDLLELDNAYIDSLIQEFIKQRNKRITTVEPDTFNYKVFANEPVKSIEKVLENEKKIQIHYKQNKNIIKKETQEIRLGYVLYQTPDTMILLVESKVMVRISRGKLDTFQLSQDIIGRASLVNINVTSKMEVRLLDSSPENNPSFDIKSVNKSDQVIDDEVFTEWIFTVVPLKSGKHELKLIISIIRNGEVKEQTWSDTIVVKNNVPKKVLTFWEKYWQWLLTTIFIPIIVYWWKKRDDKKKKI